MQNSEQRIVRKPWLILAYDNYYPDGGLNNVKCCFETEELAEDYLAGTKIRQQYDYVEVVNIFDELDLE